jgi:hypothetical protein
LHVIPAKTTLGGLEGSVTGVAVCKESFASSSCCFLIKLLSLAAAFSRLRQSRNILFIS